MPSVLNHNRNAVHDEKIKVEETERYPGPGHQIWVKVCVPLQRSENGGLLYPRNYKDYKLRPPYNMTSCRDLIFLSREGRDLGVAFQAPPG